MNRTMRRCLDMTSPLQEKRWTVAGSDIEGVARLADEAICAMESVKLTPTPSSPQLAILPHTTWALGGDRRGTPGTFTGRADVTWTDQRVWRMWSSDAEDGSVRDGEDSPHFEHNNTMDGNGVRLSETAWRTDDAICAVTLESVKPAPTPCTREGSKDPRL